MLDIKETTNVDVTERSATNGVLYRVVAAICLLVFFAMVLMPLLEALGRVLGFSVPGGASWLQHLYCGWDSLLPY